MRKTVLIISSFFIWFCFATGPVLADKASVSIEGPKSAEQGTEVTLHLTVTHNNNSFFHHTKLLKVQVDGKTFKEWEFTGKDRPEDSVFKREVKIRVTGNTEVVAEAFCNIHGSAGPAKMTILSIEKGGGGSKTKE